MSTAVVDLDDPVALREADATGALLHASMSGAQLRAVATAVAEGALDALSDIRPRALVWITGRSARAAHAAKVVCALAAADGGPLVPPIVITREMPPWVGALDVVLVSGDDAGDPDLAAAVAVAVRRGAELVVDLPLEGPIAEAADGRCHWIPPLAFVPPHRGTLRHAGAGMAVLTALGANALSVEAAADAVDTELAALGPELATPVNPAKLLAMSARGRDPLLWVHADPVAEAVCARAVAAFCDAGRVSASAPVTDAVRAHAEQVLQRGIQVDPLARLFHDPEFDGPLEGIEAPESMRYLGMVCGADEEIVRAAAASLADIEWVTEGGRDTMQPATSTDAGRVMALMARTELAAAYLFVGGL